MERQGTGIERGKTDSTSIKRRRTDGTSIERRKIDGTSIERRKTNGTSTERGRTIRTVFDGSDAECGLSERQIRKGRGESALRHSLRWTSVSFKSSSVNCHGASLWVYLLIVSSSPPPPPPPPASVLGLPFLHTY